MATGNQPHFPYLTFDFEVAAGNEPYLPYLTFVLEVATGNLPYLPYLTFVTCVALAKAGLVVGPLRPSVRLSATL